ncbi:cytochrome b N-terminal domain-containing protein [Lysobacter sp. Root690]|uniref:cytochrome b n=1 Tax=Lysobacter sp. Root690 TaxID=1736588 RepID=UPI001F279EC4|nr:cytochrome b N-terminal domain-containing protein [Lysobacter sp. Root690]
MPLISFVAAHTSRYYAPKNFNVWYYFGVLALVTLVNQLVTGIFLAMHFKPSSADAFASVEYIMRDVEWGWLIRYMHSTGASLFFVVIYCHMLRGLMYGSYKRPRELVWLLGMAIYLVLMAEAFVGYVLPWGQMSFWGAKVIISLFGAIPVIGESLSHWIMGDYVPGDATLNRFFALHVVALPLVLLLLVTVHILALHEVGSNNPDGIEIHDKLGRDGKPLDGIPFHPYYSVEDFLSTVVFLLVAAFLIFFAPTVGGLFLEHDNFIEANPLVTPEHIKPVWYFTPYYAMLRVVPDKVLGIVTMLLAIVALFLLPWLDRGKVKSIRYRGRGYQVALGVFVVSFVLLGLIGIGAIADVLPRLLGPGVDVNQVENWIGRVLLGGYFGFFAFVWVYTRFGIERTRPVPERVT